MKDNNYYANKYLSMYMDMADICAKQSLAERLKVGCIILLQDLTVLHGFNGMPSGSDTEVCEDRKWVTKKEVIHAEINAIRKYGGERKPPRGLEALYGGIAFITHSPCKDCCDTLLDLGIMKVYYRDVYRDISHLEEYAEYGMEFINRRGYNEL